jgi:hypothetical protein
LEDLYGVKRVPGLLQQLLHSQLLLEVLRVIYQAYLSSNCLPNLNGGIAVQSYEIVNEEEGFLQTRKKVVRSFDDYNLEELYHCICHVTVK